MFRVLVERTLNVPIASVFDQLADHPSYTRFPGIKSCRVIEPGVEERNGRGALRRVDLGSLILWERIRTFEAPTLMEYHIERSFPIPVRHDLGRIELEDLGDGRTRVVWRSEGGVRWLLPGVRDAVDALIEKQASQGFAKALEVIDRGR